jgi:hypothetical protein
VLFHTGKPGRSSSRRDTSVAFSPNRTKPPAISFTSSGRQAYPGLSSVRSPGLIRTSLLSDVAAFRYAGFRIAPAFSFLGARARGEPGRLRAQGRGGYVQARTVGVTTTGVDRVAT